MKISAKIDYACKAMLELSLHWPAKKPLAMSVIAGKQNIPLQFLTQILITLKQLGYVDSIRGKNGGYRLARPPAEICLDQLIADMGNEGFWSEGSDESNVRGHVMESIWKDMDQVILEHLKTLNYEIICERVRAQEKIYTFDI